MTRTTTVRLSSGFLLLALAAAIGQQKAEPGAVKEFVYKSTPQGELKLFIHFPADWKPAERRPAIVFFFGGGWTSGTPAQFTPQAEYFAGRGLVTARAEYRIFGKHKTTPDKCVADARSAVRFLRARAAELGVDPERIVAAGGSAGGHIAACSGLVDGFDADADKAVSSRPNLLVLFNPVLEMEGVRKVLDGAGNDVTAAISPVKFLKKESPPAIIFFGTNDRLLAGAESYMKKGRELGRADELFTAEAQPHGFFNRSPWREITLRQADAFLTAHGYLKGEPTIPAAAEPKLIKAPAK
jgi:acetyl esterase/lipase